MARSSFDPEQTAASGRRAARRRPGPVTHQTVRLSKGRHVAPEEGACVMELASMLAGEPFSDHPQSVCPVIASLLRVYNDAVDDDRRQELYAYASLIVGSRRSYHVERARAARLAAWAQEHQRRWWTRLLHPFMVGWSALQSRCAFEATASHAIRAISGDMDQAHPDVLALIDELLALDLVDESPLSDRLKRAPQFDDDPSRNERATIRLLHARHTTT